MIVWGCVAGVMSTAIAGEPVDEAAPEENKSRAELSQDYNAYALAPGQARVGLGELRVGLPARFELSTSYWLDLATVWNGSLKLHAVQSGPFSLGLRGRVFHVPVEGLTVIDDTSLARTGPDTLGQETDLFVSDITGGALAAIVSLALTPAWRIHGGVGLTSGTVAGSIDFRDVPDVLIPGFGLEGTGATIVSRISADLLDVRFASDVEIAQGHAIVLQSAATVRARARGKVEGELDVSGATIDGLSLEVAWAQPIAIRESFRTSLSYQRTWDRWNLRVGLGASAQELAWIVQAFDLSYRFGGGPKAI